MADSTTLLAAIMFRIGDPAGSWQRMVDGLRFFAANEAASGLARGLAMGAIVQFRHGDPSFGIRLTAKAYQLVREQEVMLAPVKVLHLPDPLDLAAEAYGAERAQALLDQAAAIPMAQVVAEVLAAGPPRATPAADPTTGAIVGG
jgi:hypothetical protein